jgi:superfamily II DNA or RNA helicase
MTILVTAHRPIHSTHTRTGNESIIVIVAKLVLKNKTTNATAAGSATDKPTGDIVSLIAWHLSLYVYTYTLCGDYIFMAKKIEINISQLFIYSVFKKNQDENMKSVSSTRRKLTKLEIKSEDRPIQKTAILQVMLLLQTFSECLVKMFCGTGKSRVIKRVVIEQKKSLSVIVFPSLALIRQFTKDYLGDIDAKLYSLLNVSSEELAHITSTTDPAQILHFLNNPKTKSQKKIICVTYQSLQVLLDNLGDSKIGLACFDEAHRTTSPETKELVYGDEYRAKYEKRVFFTATPVNANGVTMFDRERNEMGTYGDCGPLACEYTYLQGLRDAFLSLFELRVDLYTQDTLGNMYESIARAILTTGNTRVLTFHADAAAESDSETSVLRFVDKAKFVVAFRAVCAKEFPDKVGMFPDERITFRAITASTKNKDAILGEFETCSDTEIYIVASCRTIGEGVDTKQANMCVFVDPKTSPKDIIQNIGRICRKIAGTTRQPATILIPVCIGWEKYREAGDDPEVQDKLIREQLNDRENGDYNAIMNVCAALKQEDPELYELCLKYPSNFTESERKHALEEQGFRVLEEEDDDTCEGDDADDREPNVLHEYDIDELVENGERVEIHTSNTEQPIIYRGFDDEDGDADGEDADDEDEDADENERPIQRFYEVEEENEDGEMETRYHRIVPMEGREEESDNKRLNPPKTTNRPRMNIHTNDEIKLTWKMGDVMLGEQFGTGVLECEVERMDNDEIWMEKHQQMCEFIDKNGRTPSEDAKNLHEKKLCSWISNQKFYYDSRGLEFSKHGMKTQERWQIWTETLEKYNKYLVIDHVQNWKDNHRKMCEFIDKTSKTPSNESTETEEKKLATWVSGQKKNYDPRGSELSKNIMKNQEIWKIWTNTIADMKYNNYLVIDYIQIWINHLTFVCRYINKNGKRPSQHAKEPLELRLGRWISTQKKNYDPRGSESSKNIMKKSPEIWQLWTETLADEKYSESLADLVQVWKNNHKKICDFIHKTGKAPSTTAKDPEEKRLGCWISNQKKCYDPRGPEFSKCGMKNLEIWQIWMDTLTDEKYSEVLALDPVQDWKINHEKMCLHIDKNGKAPSKESKDSTEKTLANWIYTQKKKYDPRGPEFSKQIMNTTPEIWQIWTDILAYDKYSEALADLVQVWKNNHSKMYDFIDKKGKAPSQTAKDSEEKILGKWISHQKTNYDANGPEFSKHGMKNPEIWKMWTDTLADEKYSKHLATNYVQDWKTNHMTMCEFIEKKGRSPSTTPQDPSEKKLGGWVGSQKLKYSIEGPDKSNGVLMKTPEIWQIWTETIQKYPCLKKQGQETPSPKSKPKCISKKSHLIPNPAVSLECSAPETNPISNPSNPKRVITDSPYKLTGRAWSSQKSTTTHEKLRSNPAEWHAYHAARDISFQGYSDQSQIPRNRIIAHLADKRKHRLRILDLGCGRNNIAQHYADTDKDHKFAIQGYDHVVEEGSTARAGNIADLSAQEEDESADICVYSQSLMGTDWPTYLTEGHRMLRYNGEFVISEHIKMLDDVRAELGRLGCKVEMETADNVDVSNEVDEVKVPKWFVLIARKV